jgi:hypothetical protein
VAASNLDGVVEVLTGLHDSTLGSRMRGLPRADNPSLMDAGIARAHGLIQAFLALAWERRGRDLEAWITAATDSGLDALARFARGLQDDLTAVTAGLTLPWSNEHVAYGTSSPASWPVEGADPPATAAWRGRRGGHEHPGAALLLARSHTPAAAIPAPHRLCAHT